MKRLVPLACLLFAFAAQAATLKDVQHDWVEAKYHTPDKKEQLRKLDAVVAEATDVAAGGDAEAQVWEAAVLSTRARLTGGTGALSDIRAAKELLEGAFAANPPSVADGYADSILAALYGKAPGWPVSFGDNDKARKHFAAALKRNPNGIDVNTLYGEFLLDHGEDDAARAALELALQAKPRKGHEAADAGRHAEAQALLDKLN